MSRLISIRLHGSRVLPSAPLATLAPLLEQELGHKLVQFPVRAPLVDAVIAARHPNALATSQSTNKTRDAPVCEHAEAEPAHALRREHVEEVRRVCVVHIVVSASVREQEVRVVGSVPHASLRPLDIFVQCNA